MALKFKYNSREEIPTEHQPYYAEHEGAWVLDVDGAADKAKLDEFRENNITLMRERDELRTRYDGIDPEQVRAAATEKEKLEQELKAQAANIEALASSRSREIQQALQKQLGALASERDTLNARLTTIQIDNGVIAAATHRKLRPDAIPDILSRARNAITLVDGAPVVRDASGKGVRIGRDGASPMTLEEWVDTQVSEASHLFEPSAGSGAAGDASGGGGWSHGTARNPFKKETWNLTEQVRLQKIDPAMAARLRAAA